MDTAVQPESAEESSTSVAAAPSGSDSDSGPPALDPPALDPTALSGSLDSPPLLPVLGGVAGLALAGAGAGVISYRGARAARARLSMSRAEFFS